MDTNPDDYTGDDGAYLGGRSSSSASSSRSGLQDLLPEGCPLTFRQIVEADIDSFNDCMTRYNFSEDQVAQYRDLRRKGKNRQAARKSRQKRMATIDALRKERDKKQKQLRALNARRDVLKALLVTYDPASDPDADMIKLINEVDRLERLKEEMRKMMSAQDQELKMQIQ